MNLFIAAGLDVPPTGGTAKAGRGLPKTLRIPLFAHKVYTHARSLTGFAPTAEQRDIAAGYARKAKSAKFASMKETAVRPLFIQEILQKLLGYRPFNPEAPFTLGQETAIRHGAVDVALGHFNQPSAPDLIVAPCELKGPSFVDLDRIMPGRGRSPVQQAWDYAIDSPGRAGFLCQIASRFVSTGSGVAATPMNCSISPASTTSRN